MTSIRLRKCRDLTGKFLQQKRGFTLVELLTVIAIIGILAAILLPVIGSVRESARSAKCLTQLREIGSALLQFSLDNEDMIPRAVRLDNRWWMDAERYLDQREPDGPDRSPGPLFQCPSDEENFQPGVAPFFRRSYGINHVWTNAGVQLQLRPRLGDLMTPSRTIMVGEIRTAKYGSDFIIPSPARLADPPNYHRNERLNAVFFDGHVESIRHADMADPANVDLLFGREPGTDLPAMR